MQYLESLEECFDKNTQFGLINRIKIRLGTTPDIFVVNSQRTHIPSYVSEADLKKNYPINQNKLKFEEWASLRKEIENKTVECAQAPHAHRLLESIMIQYMTVFEVSSKELWGQYCDEGTGFLLRFAASRIRDLYFGPQEQFVFASLFLETMEQPKPPWSKKLVKGLVNDLCLLNRVMESMEYLAEIIQGVLFEHNVPNSLTIKSLQDNSKIYLTNRLLANRMAPLMGWTNEYCMRLMGNRAEIHLDEQEVFCATPLQAEPLGQGNEFNVAQAINEENTLSSPPQKTPRVPKDKEDPIDRRKLQILGRKLYESDNRFTQLVDGTDTWVFVYPRHKKQLYAYMGWKVTEACGLNRTPWKFLTKYIKPPKDITTEDLRKEANKLRDGTIKAPNGYVCIEDAIKSVFGSPRWTSNDVGNINQNSASVLRTKIK